MPVCRTGDLAADRRANEPWFAALARVSSRGRGIAELHEQSRPCREDWGERRVSIPHHRGPQPRVLPLNYVRHRNGPPRWSRTTDLHLRRVTLCPSELWADVFGGPGRSRTSNPLLKRQEPLSVGLRARHWSSVRESNPPYRLTGAGAHRELAERKWGSMRESNAPDLLGRQGPSRSANAARIGIREGNRTPVS